MSYRAHKLFLPYPAMVKNRKIRSCDLNLWPMTLKFSGFRAVVKIHVTAKFHQAACSGSWVWVIVLTEKKTRTKTIQSVATALTVITQQTTHLNNKLFIITLLSSGELSSAQLWRTLTNCCFMYWVGLELCVVSCTVACIFLSFYYHYYYYLFVFVCILCTIS